MAKKTENVIKKKNVLYAGGKKIASVRLVKAGHFFNVMVDKDVYASKTNELFAVQVFNAI